jgi:Bacterial SH3 domain
VALSRLRVVSDVRCDRQYWTVRDRDGWVNLRSRPNGPVTSRVNDGETVLFLKVSADGQWLKLLTPEGTIGWMHRSRLIQPL